MNNKNSKGMFAGLILLFAMMLVSPLPSYAESAEFEMSNVIKYFSTLQILRSFSGQEGEPVVRSIFVNEPLPVLDPNALAWQNAPPARITVYGQNITNPMLFNPSVTSLDARSMNNGTWIAFLLEWSDSTDSTKTLRTEQFRDAVAVSFPVTDDRTFIAMGGPNTPVSIAQWKADWQKDIDIGYQDREDEFPYMAVDLYPHAKDNATGVVPVEDINKEFVPGLAADNPLSNPVKLTPIEELVAEGFGTLTTQTHQDSIGKGIWNDGVWKVVIARPAMTPDMSDPQFDPGKKTDIAFAVWDGDNNEVGARKSLSLWNTLLIEAEGEEPLEVTPPSDEEPSGGGCLIATAAYGSEMAYQVQFLREIRDNTLYSTTSGASFMTGFNQLYYLFSPTIADWERESPVFKEAVRVFITPMISTLSIMTLAEEGSEEQILGFGISVIALNLGLYIAAPTSIAFYLRRKK